ncbi:CHASE2 domain-containing protein [Lusitaniella coriacea LEGE 07157]|uniref:CHASE2 domain-containing protein n=1 Tax=Lusitaniella coriacea LEGE 07157 TaxID=945747 RepID=A0A8J7DW81_9CYAN|nr:CHASE2 domain-containing protein [Lusitaniella coriacea]MBE9116060.1 CHASE2 domain-containing protein [Lusitaniella coriacea LEGE 07157]
MGFKLKIERIEQTCRFELEWGNEQRLINTLRYPPHLTSLYEEWQRAYLSFYKSSFRGRVEDYGNVTPPPIDWRTRLVEAEHQLLKEFRYWLRDAELFEIRSAIAKTESPHCIDIFLACYSPELERLPWEMWDISAEFPSSATIRIARTPVSIRQGTGQKRHEKPRILAILGDDTGLDFQEDKAAVRSLEGLAEIRFVGWQPGKETPTSILPEMKAIERLKREICTAIDDERGWDILLFAGHSNESIAGGELAIAPGISIFLNEIKPQLLNAKKRGLQFALFNSCSGLSLANALIDLGLSQVAILREPIHNDVARFFVRLFLNNLATHQDVHDSLLVACQILQTEENLIYPSAHFIPSLFRHPAADLYQIPPKKGIKKEILRLFCPKLLEGVALGGLTLLSLFLPIQDRLLEQRVLTQAKYRQATQQFAVSNPPPVLLISIDEESIRKAGLIDPNPMDRAYLAQIVEQLTAQDARVVGLDYLLDRSHKERDRVLAKTLQSAVQKQPHSTTFVFASVYNSISGWMDVAPEIASSNWSLNGQVNIAQWNVPLIPPTESRDHRLPFSYLLALAHDSYSDTASHPQLNSQTDLFAQIRTSLQSQGKDYRNIFSARSRRQKLTHFSYKLRQMWLHPILDFSIPPQQIYQQIPAWKFLESPNLPELRVLPQQVAIVAPGGYDEAGVVSGFTDTFPLPPAINYWFKQNKVPQPPQKLTGGEIHAYFVHHYLQQRLVVPIPDLWAIAVAYLLGKTILFGVELWGVSGTQRRWIVLGMLGAIALYGLISVQIYLWAALLFPWLFPSLTFGIAAFPRPLKGLGI